MPRFLQKHVPKCLETCPEEPGFLQKHEPRSVRFIGVFHQAQKLACIQHRWGWGTRANLSSKGLGCPATLNVGIWVSASLKNGRVCGSVCLTHWASFERTKSGAQGLETLLENITGGWPSRLGLCQAPWHSSALQCMSSQVVRVCLALRVCHVEQTGVPQRPARVCASMHSTLVALVH